MIPQEIQDYFDRRMTEMQLTPDNLRYTVRQPESGMPQEIPFFTPCNKGIEILYIHPTGEVQQYDHNGKLRPFYRTRLMDAPPDRKYSQPPKSGVRIFITPGVCDKVKNRQEIDTLFAVEGEFKAFCGYKHLGLDCIGIGGIHNFTDKGINEMHPDIVTIIHTCKVKNLILIADADCLNITESLDKDLYNRPASFCRAIMRFREYAKPLNVDVYFSHILQEYSSTAKGLDDLICHPKTHRKKLKEELYAFTTGKNKHYIECLNLSENNFKIQQYFGIDGVQSFYDRHKQKLQEHEFLYKKTRYFYDGEKLRVSWYGQATQYMRVGVVYYKRGYMQNAHGKIEETLQEWSIAEINRDYGNNKEFVSQIPKYDAFCNIPDHTENYRRVFLIEQNGLKTMVYNRYYQLSHAPEAGEWPTIALFLRHIVNTENLQGEPLYPFLLDWLQLCYTNPTQRLPVLCLVSRERGTGKTTFLEFLRLIFQENATILDNERFTGKFTSHFATKLIISVDEGFIPVEKKIMKERIKNLSTGKTQWLEAKGRNAQEIDYFGKLILCSNDENNFMQIDEGENRFAVIKVKPLEYDNPELIKELEKELPAFLYHLRKRSLHHAANVSRLWFHPDVYSTQAMKDVNERTKSRNEKEIDEFIRESFINFKMKQLEFTPKDIAEGINSQENIKYKIEKTKVAEILKDRGFKPQKLKKYTIYGMEYEPCEQEYKSKVKLYATGRPYLFYYEDFITEDEFLLLQTNSPE
jgi:hypothetical protein